MWWIILKLEDNEGVGVTSSEERIPNKKKFFMGNTTSKDQYENQQQEGVHCRS